MTAADHRFCAGCWSALRFLTPPWCATCQLPLSYDMGQGARCAACVERPPRHAGLYAAVAYGDISRTLALRLKYGGRAAFADTAARLMRRWVPPEAELLVPVPLHRRRLWSRGFNQAALIAAALSRQTNVPSDALVLERHRSTPVLRGLGGAQRSRAVRGAFRIDRSKRARVAGRRVVLVDDVHTSGATTDACVATLRRAGAAAVTILCWARVLDHASGD